LPFKKLTFGLLLEQLTEVTPHHDLQEKDIYSDLTEISSEFEPRRFNVLLTMHSKKAFYVCQTADSEKVYPNITKENPCFAFNEFQCLHGSDYIGPGKVMLMAGGLLDREKHKSMIERNLLKFKDHVITFSNQSNIKINRTGTGIE
jgi:hypothetical protein